MNAPEFIYRILDWYGGELRLNHAWRDNRFKIWGGDKPVKFRTMCKYTINLVKLQTVRFCTHCRQDGIKYFFSFSKPLKILRPCNYASCNRVGYRSPVNRFNYNCCLIRALILWIRWYLLGMATFWLLFITRIDTFSIMERQFLLVCINNFYIVSN